MAKKKKTINLGELFTFIRDQGETGIPRERLEIHAIKTHGLPEKEADRLCHILQRNGYIARNQDGNFTMTPDYITPSLPRREAA